MLTKLFAGVLAVVALTTIGYVSATAGRLNAPVTAATGDCCYPGSPCCVPGASCCPAEAVALAPDCCYPGSPCCESGSDCCLSK